MAKKKERRKYIAADGERLPGATTIIGRFKESGGLIHWAWQQGVDGNDYRKARDAAADAGTCCHAMIEADVTQREPDFGDFDTQTVEQAQRGFASYQRWTQQSSLEIIAAETMMVSEKYRYGGTPDGLGKVNGVLSVVDWKTGKAIYPDMLCQLAAYRQLFSENGYGETEEYHLLRIGRDASFHHHSWLDLSKAWEAFKLMRELYGLDKTLKGMV